ncbi:WD40 repeat domain-containing protein [Streptomyces sp. NPDC050433]|uniref:WD40 repeat domain-containing protein n=1 Tax=Streptomyces sp. NPDC050433 TaxID=3365615 RepID=UPI0037AE7BD5
MTDALLLTRAIPSAHPIRNLAVTEVAGGPLIVCADWVGHVWTWNPAQDTWLKRPLAFACGDDPAAARYPDATNEIDSLAVGVHGGRVVLVAGGDEQGVAAWDLESGRLIRGTTFEAAYTADVAAMKGAGTSFFVTAEQYSEEVALWKPVAGEPVLGPPVLVDTVSGVRSVAAAWIDGRGLIAAGGDGGVELWDLPYTTRAALFSTYDDESVLAVAPAARPGGGALAVAGVDTGEVYVWEVPADEADAYEDEALHDPLGGHEGPVNAVDTCTVGGRALAVTGGEDETVRVWDLVAGTPIADPLLGHRAQVETVLTIELHGRQVAVSAGRDGVLHVWDLAALLK